MSSSESDDCYGNVAQKLQSLRDEYTLEKVPFNDSAVSVSNSDLSFETNTNPVLTNSNFSLDSSDEDEIPLEAFSAAKNAPKSKRGRKRKAVYASEPAATGRMTRRKAVNSNVDKSINEESIVINDSPAAIPSSNNAPPRSRRRGSAVSAPITSRGRGTAQRGRGANTTPRGRGRGANTTPKGRGRGRNRCNTANIPNTGWFSSLPIYSIGNTDEYPDMCDSQELFSSKPSKSDEVQIIEDEDPLANDNEELSVKVYWQSLEVVRFKIRKYQKLTPVFKYFSDRENVGVDKLLFMYKERILKVDDTPDSIDYSIAKFIDGGIVEHDVTGLTKQNSKELKDGLRLKFQCQNVKKPFETTVRPEDKLALAMMKCSEHLETPLDRLKFYFDGDLVSGKSTAKDLELEGGECIDVKITS